MGKLKEATAYWLSLLKECKPGNRNIAVYEKYFSGMSDKEFDNLMLVSCEKGGMVLPYTCPNIEEPDVEIETCFKIGKKLKINFFQRIIETSPVTGVRKMSPVAYPILRTHVRRQAQHVTKGKSVAENTRFTDNLSGQAIGISKTAKISQPELGVLKDQGQVHAIYEFTGVRGGNTKGLREAKRALINNGEYSLADIKKLGTRSEALATANMIFRGMMFKSNL
jgi:hypothetical protein